MAGVNDEPVFQQIKDARTTGISEPHRDVLNQIANPPRGYDDHPAHQAFRSGLKPSA